MVVVLALATAAAGCVSSTTLQRLCTVQILALTRHGEWSSSIDTVTSTSILGSMSGSSHVMSERPVLESVLFNRRCIIEILHLCQPHTYLKPVRAALTTYLMYID